MTILVVLPAAAVAVSLIYYAAATLAAIRFAQRASAPTPPLPKIPPRVAVDEEASFEGPVGLRQRYQFANITLLVGEKPDFSNRKIAKVIKMAERAPKADIFVLSDADVSVDRDYLRRIVGELLADEKIGIVTCAYRARPIGTLA